MISIIMNGTNSKVRRGLMTSDSCSSTQDGRLPVVLDTHLTLPLQIQIQIQMKMLKVQGHTTDQICGFWWALSGLQPELAPNHMILENSRISFHNIEISIGFGDSVYFTSQTSPPLNLIISDWYCFENSMHFFIYDVVTAIESFVMAQSAQIKTNAPVHFIFLATSIIYRTFRQFLPTNCSLLVAPYIRVVVI